jgi:hypothetical protein
MHTCNQINRVLCVLINEKKIHKRSLKIKMEKLRNKYRSKYLFSQTGTFA